MPKRKLPAYEEYNRKIWEQQQAAQVMKIKNSGAMSFIEDKDEELSKSVLSSFQATEEEIEKKKMDVKQRIQVLLSRVEEESKRLAEFHKELEALEDPKRKEVAFVRKRIDTVNKELRPLGFTCQKKEKIYKESVEAFNEKKKEKAQLVSKLLELVRKSEIFRFKKLEELNKRIESLQ